MTKDKSDKLVRTLKMHNNYDVLPFRTMTKLERDLTLGILSRLSHTEPVKSETMTTLATTITYEQVRLELNLPDTYRNAELRQLVKRTVLKVKPFIIGDNILTLFAGVKLKDTELFVILNPLCLQLFSDFRANFSQYELPKLYSLKSRYAVALYMLLWEFRSTGWRQLSIDELRQKLEVPDSYLFRDIVAKVLKPAIKELESKGILTFYRTKGKVYEPIKNEANGRSHTVAIRLRFKKDYKAFIEANRNKRDTKAINKTAKIVDDFFDQFPEDNTTETKDS